MVDIVIVERRSKVGGKGLIHTVGIGQGYDTESILFGEFLLHLLQKCKVSLFGDYESANAIVVGMQKCEIDRPIKVGRKEHIHSSSLRQDLHFLRADIRVVRDATVNNFFFLEEVEKVFFNV